jgi:hypothetical protein
MVNALERRGANIGFFLLGDSSSNAVALLLRYRLAGGINPAKEENIRPVLTLAEIKRLARVVRPIKWIPRLHARSGGETGPDWYERNALDRGGSQFSGPVRPYKNVLGKLRSITRSTKSGGEYRRDQALNISQG